MVWKSRKQPFDEPEAGAIMLYESETDDTSHKRGRRAYWFGVDQAFNSSLIAAVVLAFATHAVFKGPPEIASSPVGQANLSPSKFITATVTKGDIFVRVSAAGTVEPVRLVEVSTELSGTISKVHVDNNDTVKAGQLLAELDPQTLKNELDRAEAQVSAAKARMREAEAGTAAAAKDLIRKRKLAARDLTTARDLDNANANSQQTKASLEALTAELRVAEANFAIARANLDKGRILSPVDGIVLRRNIEPGQTVAASLQSPMLFRLAQDLQNMQIRVDVDEADALNVSEGQAATFSVQALRDRQFDARVDKLYIGPEIVQGVVTYKAILSYDNTGLGLRPGMTATADIVVANVKDALLVPNAALRFTPPEDVKDEDSLLIAGSRVIGARIDPAHANDDAAGQRPSEALRNAKLRRIWIDDNGKPKAIEVVAGATDGAMTQIISGGLKTGDRVIVNLQDESESSP